MQFALELRMSPFALLTVVVIDESCSADFDGNGFIDIAVASDTLTVFYHDKPGEISPFSSSTTVVDGDKLGFRNMTCADYDGDGFIDILAFSPTSAVMSLWRNDASLQFAAFSRTFVMAGYASVVEMRPVSVESFRNDVATRSVDGNVMLRKNLIDWGVIVRKFDSNIGNDKLCALNSSVPCE